MSFNRKEHLTDNIKAIGLALELEKSQTSATPEQIEILRKYCGFGGLKCILQPCEHLSDMAKWNKSNTPLFLEVQNLYGVLKKYAESDRQYKQYADSLKSSVLTTFYTPPEIVKAIANKFAESGIVAENFLDPSAGTGVFLSAFKNG